MHAHGEGLWRSDEAPDERVDAYLTKDGVLVARQRDVGSSEKSMVEETLTFSAAATAELAIVLLRARFDQSPGAFARLRALCEDAGIPFTVTHWT